MASKSAAFVAVAFFAGTAFGCFVLAGQQITEVSYFKTQVGVLKSQLAQSESEVEQLHLRNAQLEAEIAELNASLASHMSGEPAILAVRFSPRGGAGSEVAYWIGRANRSVHVLIYSFTLDSVGDAVIGAFTRGVDVKVVFEKTQVSKYSEYFRLADSGIKVRNDTNPSLMHHKVAIIDGSIILIGSFNWSSSADGDNNENLLVIRSSNLALTLEHEFQRIWEIGT